VSHATATLTPRGRLLPARCVLDQGWTLRRAAERFQVSATTAGRWAGRYREHGAAGRHDRSSRPHRSPRRTPIRTQRRLIKVRVIRRWGPARLGFPLGLHPSTVYRVLSRSGMARLTRLDRPTGRVVRRYEHAAPRRPRARRRQEARPDPRRRRLACPRPRRPAGPHTRTGRLPTCTRPSTTTPGWPTPMPAPVRRTWVVAGTAAALLLSEAVAPGLAQAQTTNSSVAVAVSDDGTPVCAISGSDPGEATEVAGLLLENLSDVTPGVDVDSLSGGMTPDVSELIGYCTP
jgi:hypothetical protein